MIILLHKFDVNPYYKTIISMKQANTFDIYFKNINKSIFYFFF